MPVDFHVRVLSESRYREIMGFINDECLDDPEPGEAVQLNHLTFEHNPDPERLSAETLREGSYPSTETVVMDSDYASLIPFAEQGVRSVWLNREGKAVLDWLPMHDLELTNLEGLLDLRKILDRPTLNQCLGWWADWGVPENVRLHVQCVARAAYHLAVMMRKAGISVDPILTHRGGLLHDIDKIQTLKQSGAHGRQGAAFLSDAGYPEVAEIVGEHILHTILSPGAEECTWEVKLVYFCDKLVEGDQIVPMEERLSALKARYPGYRQLIMRSDHALWRLSDQVCSILSLPDHEALIALLKADHNQFRE